MSSIFWVQLYIVNIVDCYISIYYNLNMIRIKEGGETKMSAYTERGGYRKYYQKAALALIKKYPEEHKELMVELGYVKPETKNKKVSEKSNK